GLSSSSENIDAVSVDAQGRLYLSTTGNFSVPGRSGTNEDVFVFTASSLGSSTSGSLSSSLYVDGSALGLGGNDIRGVTLPEQVPAIGASLSGRPAKRGSFDQPSGAPATVENYTTTDDSA